MKEKAMFLEISYMRPILIVLLVFYHTFIIYNGGWTQPEGFEPCVVYKWLDRLFYSFMLPAFVFMSGYVWGGQIQGFGKKDSFLKTVQKKFKRLIIPSIIFSILYLLLMQECPDNYLSGAISILSGVRHMWFLPMLFWCFVMGYVLMTLKLPHKLEIAIAVILGLFNFLPLPFRLGEALGYLQYFYIGYLMWPYSGKINSWLDKNKIISLWMLFFILFYVVENLSDKIHESLLAPDISIIGKAAHWSCLEFIRSIMSWVGLFAFYATSLRFVNVSAPSDLFTRRVVKIGNLCFGVYLFQQFIIHIIYYMTPMPQVLGLWLPWVTFSIVLILSLILSYIVRLSKIGRQIF